MNEPSKKKTKQPLTFSFHYQDAVKVNRSIGYDAEDSLAVLYDDCIARKKGNKAVLEKYGFKGNPKDVGKYLLFELKQEERKNPKFLPESVLKNKNKHRQEVISNTLIYIFLTIVAAIVFIPILRVAINSFKANGEIATNPLKLPTAETFVGIDNFKSGFEKSKFRSSFGYSLFITVFSTLFILLFCSMTAWFITRVKTWWTKLIYYVILFSQVVPFQLVMLPMNQIASTWKLNNRFGIIIIYVGFGAGLSVFRYSGFVKSVPVEVEEAARIDGCNPIQTFFTIVFPILKPTTITIAILNVRWIWNDYLLPNMVLGTTIGKTTIPVAIQMVANGSYGATDYGRMRARIVLTRIPIIVFYLFGQKYIIKGVTAGAVKG